MNELLLEQSLSGLAADASAESAFLRELPVRIMQAYQAPAAQIARAVKDNQARLDRKGATTLLDGATPTHFLWSKYLHYAPAAKGQAHDEVERLRAAQKSKTIPGKTGPRFVISSDGDAFAAIDLRTGEARRTNRRPPCPL